jgi:chemotaxis protein methyltransferase CheR
MKCRFILTSLLIFRNIMKLNWRPCIVLVNHNIIVQAIELIESRIGIAVGKQFHDEFADLFKRLSRNEPLSYLHKLQTQDEKSSGWQRLINTMTVGETYFLREENHFNLLKKHILPKLILRRRQQHNHTLRIWSAGCASGEEPYSVAIILHEFIPDIAKWTIEIQGTDINEYVLQSARHGIYREWAFRHSDTLFQQNYFDKVDGGFQIKPFIKDKVAFRQQNLLHEDNLHKYDIVFCKNVLLYFDAISTKKAEGNLFQSLNPQGWLFLGQAEAINFDRDRWQTHIFPGSPIYQRPDNGLNPIDIEYRTISPDEEETQPVAISNHENYYESAVEAIHDDNNTRAEHYLSLALYHNHELAQCHTLLAWLFANRKAFPEAEAHIKAALAINPLHADAHYVTALASLEQGQLDDAHRALQMTLYCDKYHALAAFMLGNLYAQIGNLPKAYSQWAKVQWAIEALDPSNYISDLSDLTAGQLDALIGSHLSDT